MRSGFRVVMCAECGFPVSAGWGFYFATANKVPIRLIVDALARLTQPAAAVVVYFNPDYLLGLRAVAIANAVTYAFVGLIVETIWRDQSFFDHCVECRLRHPLCLARHIVISGF